MGFFDFLKKKTDNKEEEEKEEDFIRCDFENCKKEASKRCRFCGKPFCSEHVDPLKHNCEHQYKAMPSPINPAAKGFPAPDSVKVPELPPRAPEA